MEENVKKTPMMTLADERDRSAAGSSRLYCPHRCDCHCCVHTWANGSRLHHLRSLLAASILISVVDVHLATHVWLARDGWGTYGPLLLQGRGLYVHVGDWIRAQGPQGLARSHLTLRFLHSTHESAGLRLRTGPVPSVSAWCKAGI
jgi:hypothetical protein